MKIIKLSEANIPELLLIENEAHLSPWSEKLLYASFGHRKHNYGVFKKNRLIGYYFSEYVAGEMTLENICIAPEFQGLGVGKQLLSHLFDIANELQTEDLFLEVRESNAAAIRLYQSTGFEQIGFRKNYYPIANSQDRETAILMKKSFIRTD